MNIKFYLIFIAAFFSFISADANEDNDTTFIYFKDGKVVAFPNEYVVSQQNHVINHIVGLRTFSSSETIRADYDNDGIVNITDLMYLVNLMVGEIVTE